MAQHEYNNISLKTMYEAIGFEGTRKDLYEHIMPAIISNFSDEVVMEHDGFTDPDRAKLFGETDYSQGDFGQRVRALLEADSEVKPLAYDLVAQTATNFASEVVRDDISLPIKHPLTVDTASKALHFDGHSVEIGRPVQRIIDYRSGLGGAALIEEQLTQNRRGEQPFVHHPISGNLFTNHYLTHIWLAKLTNSSLFYSRIHGQYFQTTERTITDTTTDYIHAGEEYYGSAEVADIVIAAKLGRHALHDIESGIANGFKLLRPRGVMLVQATIQDLSEGTYNQPPIRQLIEMAYDAGFDKAKQKTFITQATESAPEIPLVSAVFTK